MKLGLSPAERRSLMLVFSLVLAGYALVAWRHVHSDNQALQLDSLDLAFVRRGVELKEAAAGLNADSMVASLWFPLDLNQADSLDLLRLPGVGPSRASAILRLRQEQGAFHTLEELLQVRGIGPATLRDLKEKLIINREPIALPGKDSTSQNAEIPEGAQP